MPKLLINKKTPITLGQTEYKAQGGQGTVYVKSGVAYKVYHEADKMIPEGKIIELSQIGISNVLAPKDILYNEKMTPIGFTMPFVENTEYLTKIFSRGFKDSNGISNEMVVKLVTEMQKVLAELHTKGIIVGDYNEMNFLVDKSFTIPYHIDVDSYQTKSFPCTAIMDTVRDRRLPFGKFDELSDWFSWGIVTFQMYMGIHPFMGRHPNFKTTELDARMKQNVSVFNAEVRLPKSCQDFSVIPQKHLDWYKSVFVDGKRSVPPFADSTGAIRIVTAVTSIGSFSVELVFAYDSDIIDVQYFNGTRYVMTQKGIHKLDKEMLTFNGTKRNLVMLDFPGYDPIIAMPSAGKCVFFNLSRNEIGSIEYDGYMVCNGIFYTVTSGSLIEHTFEKYAKITHLTTVVDNIAPVFKTFSGFVIQDVFGKRRLSIPYGKGLCASVNVPELEGYRVVDGKMQNKFCVLIGEKSGKYDRIILYFTKDFNSYEVRVDSDISYRDVNMTVRQNGMMVSIINDDTMELMMDLSRGSKEIPDCPVEIGMPLADGIDRTLFVNGTKLYSVKMK